MNEQQLRKQREKNKERIGELLPKLNRPSLPWEDKEELLEEYEALEDENRRINRYLNDG